MLSKLQKVVKFRIVAFNIPLFGWSLLKLKKKIVNKQSFK